MFRILGWSLFTISALFALGAISALYWATGEMASGKHTLTLAFLAERLKAPLLFAACALLVAILGRRFLIRARWARKRRARAEEASRMTDLFS